MIDHGLEINLISMDFYKKERWPINIFLGYREDAFDYMLCDLINKKVIRSQDIIFMEEKTIKDKELEKASIASQHARFRPSGREPTR